jgi:hypothetical protein
MTDLTTGYYWVQRELAPGPEPAFYDQRTGCWSYTGHSVNRGCLYTCKVLAPLVPPEPVTHTYCVALRLAVCVTAENEASACEIAAQGAWEKSEIVGVEPISVHMVGEIK